MRSCAQTSGLPWKRGEGGGEKRGGGDERSPRATRAAAGGAVGRTPPAALGSASPAALLSSSRTQFKPSHRCPPTARIPPSSSRPPSDPQRPSVLAAPCPTAARCVRGRPDGDTAPSSGFWGGGAKDGKQPRDGEENSPQPRHRGRRGVKRGVRGAGGGPQLRGAPGSGGMSQSRSWTRGLEPRPAAA